MDAHRRPPVDLRPLTSGVIAGWSGLSKWDDPTPCREWTVRDLLEHMIGVVAGLGVDAAGKTPAPFELSADPAKQFDDCRRRGPRRVANAWRPRPASSTSGPGAMPGHVVAGINLLDTATHTWDLATATGQPAELCRARRPHRCPRGRRATKSSRRRSAKVSFAAVQSPPGGAYEATDRLVAFLWGGRRDRGHQRRHPRGVGTTADRAARGGEGVEPPARRPRGASDERSRGCPSTRSYVFDGADGRRRFPVSFGERSQLLTYHFMFGPDWDEGCPSCSFLTDCFDGTGIHLTHRDVTLRVCVAQAPYRSSLRVRRADGMDDAFLLVRTGATSTTTSTCRSLRARPRTEPNTTSRRSEHPYEELPGISVFAKTDDGRVFHTYSSYERGLDPLVSGVPAPRPGTEGPRREAAWSGRWRGSVDTTRTKMGTHEQEGDGHRHRC